jgi:hypothetical protein
MTQHRTESFIPLTAATTHPERREFAVTVLPGDGNGMAGTVAGGTASSQFHALATPSPVARPQKTSMATSPCEPKVTVQRDGKRVTHLHITCTCGETIDLACLYDEPSGS